MLLKAEMKVSCGLPVVGCRLCTFNLKTLSRLPRAVVIAAGDN